MAVHAPRLFDDIIRALSLVLDWHEGEQLLHAWRVAWIAQAVAREAGEADPSLHFYAGLLHDLGAVEADGHPVDAAARGFPDAGDREHPAASVRILAPLRVLAPALALVADHHERLDGGGFPRGRRGDAIAPGAFVIALADRVELACRAAGPAGRDAAVRALLRDEAGRAWPAPLSAAALALLDRDPGVLAELHDPVRLRALVERAGDPARWVAGLEPVELLGQLLWLFPRVVEARHPSTLGHAVRVTRHAHRIARALGEDGPDVRDVVFAGLLHDVGLAALPRALVAGAGHPSHEAEVPLQRHARETHTVLASIRDLAYLAAPAASHHEHYDGSGFPFGLAGEEIPLLGRILAYADAFDGLTAPRPGRPGLPPGEALDRLRAGVGSRFDPHLAEVALAALGSAPAAPDDGGGRDALERLLVEDAPDVRRAVDRTLRGAEGREPGAGGAPAWRVVEFDAGGEARRGLDALRAVAGAREGVRLAELVGSDALRRLEALAAGDEDPTASAPLVGSDGRAVEAILRRRGDGWELLYRDAGGQARSVERMALFYRNFVASSEATFFVDAEGRLVDASPRFLDLYRYDLAALVGRTPPVFAGASRDAPGFAALLARAHEAERGGWIGEAATFRRDGAPVPALTTVTVVRDAARAVVGYAFRLVDLSPQLRLEQELAAKNASLEAVDRLKSELLAIASHDLKAPVAGMIGHARLLRASLGALSAEAVASRLDLVVRLGRSGLDLIDRMLCLERIEAGTFRLDVVPVRPDELLGACVEALGPVAQERGVELGLRLPAPVRVTTGDPLRLAQVLNNLVSNAIRHAPPGSRVEAACADLGDRIRFEVADRGPGIPEAERERIFDRYYQVAGRALRPGSVGLGLYVTRTVVSLHGGRVWAEGREGGGSRFVVELPAGRLPLSWDAPAAVLVDPAATLAPQLVPLLGASGLRPLVARDWVEAARLAAASGPALLFAPWREAELRRRAAAAAPGSLAVAIREPADPPAPPDPGLDVLDTPVLDAEIAALAQQARRRHSPPGAKAPAPPPAPQAATARGGAA